MDSCWGNKEQAELSARASRASKKHPVQVSRMTLSRNHYPIYRLARSQFVKSSDRRLRRIFGPGPGPLTRPLLVTVSHKQVSC